MRPSLHSQRGWKTPCRSLILAKSVSNHLCRYSHWHYVNTSVKDNRPVQYLFRPPPLPTAQNLTLSATKTSFKRFKSALQSQIACRTPLLDEVLSAIEDGIRYLHDDMDVVHDIKGDSRYVSSVSAWNMAHPFGPSSLVADLRTQYRRDTARLCDSISGALVTALEGLSDDTGKFVRKVITRTQLNFLSELALKRVMFIGRIANELSTSSTVFDSLDCEPVTLDGGRMFYTAFILHTKLVFADFRTKLKQIREKAMSQRREWNITGTLKGYRCAISKTTTIDESGKLVWCKAGVVSFDCFQHLIHRQR